MIHGSHNMKFGAEVRPVTLWNDQLGGTTYTFPNVAAFLSNSPSSVQFLGDLSFLNELRKYIPTDGFQNPPSLDVTADGVTAG